MARLVNESGVMGDSFEATAENVKDIPFDQLIEAIHIVQTEMGITGTTAKEASETVSGSFDAMKAAFQNLAAGFGDSNADIELLMQNLWETVQTFAGNIKGVLETMWDNLPLEDWQKWLGVIVVAIGPVMMVLGGLIRGVQTAIGVFKLLGAVFSLLTSPIGLIVVAIGLLVGALVYLWTTNEEFRNKIIGIWNAILDFLLPIIETIKTFIMDTWNNLSTWWAENQEGIKNTVDTVWNAIKSIFDSVVTLITGIVEAGLEQIRQFWDRWGTVITAIVQVAWAFIKSIFSNTLNNILSVVSGVINQIKIIFQFAMDFIKNLVNTVLAFIRGDWEGVLNGIKGMASAFGTFIKNTFVNMMNTAKNLVSNGINAIKGFFDRLWNIDLSGAGRAIIDGFLRGLKSAYEGVKNFVGGIADWIAKNKGPISYDKKLLIGAGQAIMQGLDRGLTDKFKDVQRNVSSMAGSIADAVTDASAMGNNLNNALASSVGGSYSMTANGQLTINQQPAYINLDLGGRSYRAFVEDISNAQSQNVRFEESYSL